VSRPRLLFLVGLVLAAASCAGGRAGPRSSLDALRDHGRGSSDGDDVGLWALGEMFSPGGNVGEVQRAEARLRAPDVTKTGMYGNLARGVLADVHGTPRLAADAYVATLKAASGTLGDARAPMVAWYASHHLLGLRGSVHELYATYKAPLEALVAAPGNIGWRAAAEILEWSAAEAFDKAQATGDAYDALVTQRLGCAKALPARSVTAGSPTAGALLPPRHPAPGRPRGRRTPSEARSRASFMWSSTAASRRAPRTPRTGSSTPRPSSSWGPRRTSSSRFKAR
jgi:hypothetical protein